MCPFHDANCRVTPPPRVVRAPAEPVDQLPGDFRVRVYAAPDTLTGKRHDLTEVVPPGPRAAAEAEKVRARLLNQVDDHATR